MNALVETPIGLASREDFAQYEISPSAYAWTARAFRTVRRMLGVNVTLHHDPGQLESGDIFLFNHFARFETFIPQFFIYEELGAYSRAVASSEFFESDDALSSYLRSVGAVPNSMPGLLPFLAGEILRGSKVVVFPEGGMVKDRRVIDPHGQGLSVYSRTAGERRKHHSGPAVLALILDTFKAEVRRARRAGEWRRLDHWAQGLGFEDPECLLALGERPTRIVPCNITFYPLRVEGNLLSQGAKLLNRGISRRAVEELLVESNILFRDTDMDIRLGDPVDAIEYWGQRERRLMSRVARQFKHLDDFFSASRGEGGWSSRILRSRVNERVYAIRDEYMWRMYQSVTVNLSHLASALILALLDSGLTRVALPDFKAMLYTLVKRVQTEPDIHLHAGIAHPEGYEGLLGGHCDGFEQFMGSKSAMHLLHSREGYLEFSPSLREEHGFDEVRLNNLVAVYANEVAPLSQVAHHTNAVLNISPQPSKRQLALHRFDDELRRFELEKKAYQDARFDILNAKETATLSGVPYLYIADTKDTPYAERVNEEPRAPLGVVLVHGFLASPAELRGLGKVLHKLGIPVLGARLAGHGTSPYDLNECTAEDWLDSVARAQCIMNGLACAHILVGFSTGASLCVIRAGQPSFGLRGVVAVNPAGGFHDPRMSLVPAMSKANTVISALTGTEGVMPFRPNDSENPEINYASIPIHSLAEVANVANQVHRVAPRIGVPLRLIQSTRDPVVDPRAARELADSVPAELVEFISVQSDLHGIVYSNVGETWGLIQSFVERHLNLSSS